MLKFMLNLNKPNNYAFFCPVSKMHLTVSSPVGYANEVTPAILTGLRVKSLIDVDNVINAETGAVNEEKPKTKEAAPVKEEKVVVPKEEATVNPVESTESKEVEVVADEAPKTTSKKGKKATKETE